MRNQPFTTRRALIALILFACAALVLASAPSSAVQAFQNRPAQLAVVGIDGNLRIYDGEGENPFVLTDDARIGQRLYAWPTWSTDGRLAYFGSSQLEADGYSLRVFTQRVVAPGESAQIAFTAQGDVFTYAYWSPGDCTMRSTNGSASASGDGCRDLAVLYTPANGDGLGLRILRHQGQSVSEWDLIRGTPFYYSFSPDGTRMIWHRSDTQIEVYDVQQRRLRDLDDRPGNFGAPMWSPQDDRWLIAVRGTQAGTSNVILAEGDERTVLLVNQSSPVAFAFSPDGRRAAILNHTGELNVLDLDTRDVIASRSLGYTLAFFWSPDSRQIAYLGLPRDSERTIVTRQLGTMKDRPAQPRSGISLSILDVEAQSSTLLGTYRPTSDMVYYLRFFDQFSRSHALWSPDGRYFSLGALDAQNQPAVVLFDIETPGVTKTIADATMGIWNWP